MALGFSSPGHPLCGIPLLILGRVYDFFLRERAFHVAVGIQVL